MSFHTRCFLALSAEMHTGECAPRGSKEEYSGGTVVFSPESKVAPTWETTPTFRSR